MWEWYNICIHIYIYIGKTNDVDWWKKKKEALRKWKMIHSRFLFFGRNKWINRYKQKRKKKNIRFSLSPLSLSLFVFTKEETIINHNDEFYLRFTVDVLVIVSLTIRVKWKNDEKKVNIINIPKINISLSHIKLDNNDKVLRWIISFIIKLMFSLEIVWHLSKVVKKKFKK